MSHLVPLARKCNTPIALLHQLELSGPSTVVSDNNRLRLCIGELLIGSESRPKSNKKIATSSL